MQYNPNSLWAGHRSAVRRGSGVTGRGAGSWQLAHHRAAHPAPRSFQKKAAPAAVQTPRFQKIASIQLPLAPTTRLLIECKGYKSKVTLGIIRGAVGLRTDLNAFRQLQNETIERRIHGRPRLSNPEHFPYYHVAVASLFGFSLEAQHYAAAHHVELLDYSKLPIIGGLAKEIEALPTNPARLRSGWRQAVKDALSISVPPAINQEDSQILGDDVAASLSRIRKILCRVSASYVATLANGLTVNMLASQPLRLPTRQAKADSTFLARFADDHLSWWLEGEGMRLEFNIPGELLQLWMASGESLQGALKIKQKYMQRIELVGPIVDANNNRVFRHMVGEMDPDFLLQIQRARRLTRRPAN